MHLITHDAVTLCLVEKIRRSRRLALATLAFGLLLFSPIAEGAQVKISHQEIFHKFFLDHPPTEADVTRVPSVAKDIFVAKVRILGGPATNAPMENGGKTKRLDKYFLQAKIKIIEMISGGVDVKAPYYLTRLAVVRSGQPASFMFPRTVSQLNREYYVVSFVDDDGARYLLGMPIDPSEYEQWCNTLR